MPLARRTLEVFRNCLLFIWSNRIATIYKEWQGSVQEIPADAGAEPA
jgi:hypothetical protein